MADNRLPGLEQQQDERDNNNAGVVLGTPRGYFHGPQYSNNETIRQLTEEVRATRAAQGAVLQELRELRIQNQNYQLANAGLVAMNTNQQRIIQQMFEAHQPHLEEEVRQFHQAEAAFNRNQAGAVVFQEQGAIWERFQSWSRHQQCISVVIIVGVTAIVGFFAWKFIAFFWCKIVDFVEEYGQSILEKFTDIVQTVYYSPIFGPIREAIRKGNPLEIIACTEQLLSWQTLFTILTLFLNFSSRNRRRNNDR